MRSRHAHAGRSHNLDGMHAELLGYEVVVLLALLDEGLHELGVVLVLPRGEHVLEEKLGRILDAALDLLVGAAHGPFAAAKGA